MYYSVIHCDTTWCAREALSRTYGTLLLLTCSCKVLFVLCVWLVVVVVCGVFAGFLCLCVVVDLSRFGLCCPFGWLWVCVGLWVLLVYSCCLVECVGHGLPEVFLFAFCEVFE